MYKFLLSGVVTALCASCFDAKDFDFDKFNYDNLHPQLHLPLLSDTLYISEVMEGDGFQFINGQGYFVFDAGKIDMPEIADFFTLPSQELGLDIPIPLPQASGYQAPGIFIQVPGFEVSGEATTPLSFDAEGIVLKSVSFSGGVIRLQNEEAFSGGGTLTVAVPELKRNGQPFSKSINVASMQPQTISLAGYTLKAGSTGRVAIQWRYVSSGFAAALSTAQINLGYSLSLSNIAISEARGYFGKHTGYAKQTIDVGDFDNIKGTWGLKEAFIALEIENSIDLPLRVTIDTVRAYPAKGAAVEKVRVDSLYLGAGATLDTLTIPGDLISVLPKKMDVALKIQSNPNGNTGQDNVIRSSGSASVKAKVLAPLKIKDVNMTLTDTVHFDVSGISFDNAGLLLNVSNSLPVGVKLQCTLLKKGTKQSLGALFDAPVSIPAGNIARAGDNESAVTAPSETRQWIKINDGTAKKMKEADGIIVSFTVATGDGNTYVRISEKNSVSLKIGVSAGVNLKELMEN
jgi:hypothetical protein